MSRIYKAFNNQKAFIGFLTAGDPDMESTIEYVLAMEEAGADLIEIGIPFSDPTAEGEVIQAANLRALKKGMNVDKVFEIVEKIREYSQIPLVFLTYLNPVFHYGYEAFFKKCEEIGIDGMICPDLPYEEKGEVVDYAKEYGIGIISLIAPTSEDRTTQIAGEAEGFIYVVSSMGVTGIRSEIQTNLEEMIGRIREVTNTPVAIGCGIKTPMQAQKMAELADGVIVGSAIVKIIEQYGTQAKEHLQRYIGEMKEAL